jgi:hypothetical protein
VADAWWIPVHLAAGVSFQADSWEGGAELGPNITLLSVLGRDLEQAESQLRFEWGARSAGFARFWFSRNFALHLSAEALIRPKTYALLIDPQGRVGFTPVLWLGGSAGVSLKLD